MLGSIGYSKWFCVEWAASLISVRLCFHPTDVFLFSIIENARAVTASPKAITLQQSGQPGLAGKFPSRMEAKQEC